MTCTLWGINLGTVGGRATGCGDGELQRGGTAQGLGKSLWGNAQTVLTQPLPAIHISLYKSSNKINAPLLFTPQCPRLLQLPAHRFRPRTSFDIAQLQTAAQIEQIQRICSKGRVGLL